MVFDSTPSKTSRSEIVSPSSPGIILITPWFYRPEGTEPLMSLITLCSKKTQYFSLSYRSYEAHQSRFQVLLLILAVLSHL